MILFDTHSHLFLSAFKDIDEVIARAVDAGIKKILLPNIDNDTIVPMLDLCRKYPDICYPMIGLHPTKIKEDFEKELKITESRLRKDNFYAVGETGIDLHWDTAYLEQQKKALKKHLEWAEQYDLPIVIHHRKSINETIDVLEDYNNKNITGIFHCFTGTYEEAGKIIEKGFKLGIGGVVTYKNSGLDEVLKKTDISNIVLETDSPYLAPVPHRGKRNESAYLVYIAERVADIYGLTIKEVAEITTRNALNVFKGIGE